MDSVNAARGSGHLRWALAGALSMQVVGTLFTALSQCQCWWSAFFSGGNWTAPPAVPIRLRPQGHLTEKNAGRFTSSGCCVVLIQAGNSCRVEFAVVSSSAPGIYSCRGLFLFGCCGLMVSAPCLAMVSASSAAVVSCSSDSVNNFGVSILQHFPSRWALTSQRQ